MIIDLTGSAPALHPQDAKGHHLDAADIRDPQSIHVDRSFAVTHKGIAKIVVAGEGLEPSTSGL